MYKKLVHLSAKSVCDLVSDTGQRQYFSIKDNTFHVSSPMTAATELS